MKQWPEMTNENVDEKRNIFVEAVEDQNRVKVVGSCHIFMINTQDDEGAAMVVPYIDDKYMTDENKIRLIHALADWAKK